MRVGSKLVIIVCTIGLCTKLSAQQTEVVINLTEQTACLFQNGRLAFVSPIASSKDLNHQCGNFGLVTDAYGRIVNPNATPGSYVPPGCHYQAAPMPYFMEF